MTDSRLSDTRVHSARKPVWDQGETEWDDNNKLRPGFVERLAPYDPTPEYSRLDVLDGLPRPVRADSLRAPAPVIPVPHTMFGPMRVLFWMVAIGVPAVVLLAVVFMVGRWSA